MAVEQEMASTLIDFMDRRAALLLFGPDSGLAGLSAAAEIMADLLNWDPQRTDAEVVAYRAYAMEHRVPALPQVDPTG